MIHQRNSGEPASEVTKCATESSVKDVGKVDDRKGEEGENGLKALGWGNSGRSGRRPKVCKVENISTGARIANARPLRLRVKSEGRT